MEEERQLRLGFQRITDSYHPPRYRELLASRDAEAAK
jgi:hypothetical protein